MENETPSSRPGLIRGLGFLMATAVVVGTVIGSGIFKKPQSVAEKLPTFQAAAVVWIAGGVLALLGSLSLAEVAVIFPRAGGNYVFLREAFGRLAAFLWGWVEFLIIKSASMAALATIFTESFHDLLKQTMGKDRDSNALEDWEQAGVTMGVILVLALVNVRGVRWGGGVQLAVTTVKIASLLGITLLPWILLALGKSWSVPENPQPQNAAPAGIFEVPAANYLTALLGVLFAYHGWMNIAPVAGEIREPQRNIPLALIIGIVLVIVVYLGANLSYYQVLPAWEMPSMKATPVATVFATRLLGNVGGMAISAAVMCSVFGALNGNLLTAPRLLYAMGEDGLIPRALGAVHPKYHTPAVAILVMSGWSVLLVLSVALLGWAEILDKKNKSHFDTLTDFAMFGAIMFETLAIGTIFVFRRRLPNVARPYRCWGYPVTPILYILMMFTVLGNMFINQRLESATGVGLILAGAAVYFVFHARKGASTT